MKLYLTEKKSQDICCKLKNIHLTVNPLTFNKYCTQLIVNDC